MTLFAPVQRLRTHVFIRAIANLRPERGKAVALTSAGACVAILQVIEPVLFGKAVNGLASAANPLSFVAMWCAIGVLGY